LEFRNKNKITVPSVEIINLNISLFSVLTNPNASTRVISKFAGVLTSKTFLSLYEVKEMK